MAIKRDDCTAVSSTACFWGMVVQVECPNYNG